MEYKELNKLFWSHHLWTIGYFVASSENVIITTRQTQHHKLKPRYFIFE